MAEKKNFNSSVDRFNTAFEPMTKNISFDNTSMKDKKIVGKTDGEIPYTQAQDKIKKQNEFFDPYVDAVTAVPTALFNAVAPKGWRKGQTNRFIQTKEDIAQIKAQQEQDKFFRLRNDRVKNNVLKIATTAKNKYIQTGDSKFLDLAIDAKSKIFGAEGVTNETFANPGDSEFRGMRDSAGLFTNSPDPLPIVELHAKVIGGGFGSYFGEKTMQKNFLKGVEKGAKRSKGNWLKRAAGAVLGGASSVAVADLGYEYMLDIMDQAGQAKAIVNDPQKSAGFMDAILAGIVPDAATFGDVGINRPGAKERIESAVDEFKFDAFLTSAFFGARPLYYLTKKGVGKFPFGQFGPNASKNPNMPTNKDLLNWEQQLITKYAPKGYVKTLDDGTVIKTPEIDLTFNLPLGLGKPLWKMVNSNAPFNPFRFLGGVDNAKYSGKGMMDDWWPEPETMQGSMLGRQMIGNQLAPKIASTMAPAPLFGGGIRNNMAKQGDFYMQAIGSEMLGKFAPYANMLEMSVDWGRLASANARGFVAKSKELEKIFDDSAMGAGKIFKDETMVTISKQILKTASNKQQVDKAGNLIPRATTDKLVDFVREQIIRPVSDVGFNVGQKASSHSMRDLNQMKGLKEEMDVLLKPMKDNTMADTPYADDITRLLRAWETDIGSVKDMGYPEVSQAFTNYDNFVSKGMLLWGTDVGKAAIPGSAVAQRGFNITLEKDGTRAGHTLFDVLVEAAEKNPTSAYQELAAMKRIVGPRNYHNGVGVYIRDAFSDSIGEKGGMLMFDSTGFRKKLGIGSEGSALKAFMEEALPGPVVSKFKIFDGQKGHYIDFDDELYSTGVNAGIRDMLGEEVPKGLLKAETRQLPTMKEFDRLSKIMEKLFINGVPDPSKYMMRRAIMSGTRNSLKALLPQHALGMSAKEGAAGAAGMVMGGWLPAATVAWGIQHMGKVLTRPIAMNVFMNALDANIPSTIRLANFARLVRMFPEEWSDFDGDLGRMQKEAMMKEQRGGGALSNAVATGREAINLGQKVLEKGADTYKKYNSPNLLDLMNNRKQQEPLSVEDTMYAPQANLGGGGGSGVGSSITNNSTMNPGAAASLYQGDTDAALANQFGGGATQYAADGGIMNAVMDNKGKFSEIQKGINDNPFLQKVTGI